MVKDKVKWVYGRKWWWGCSFSLLFFLISVAYAQFTNTIMGTIQQSFNTFGSSQRRQDQIYQQQAMSVGHHQSPDDLGLQCLMLPVVLPDRIPLCQPRPPSPQTPSRALMLEALHWSQLFQNNAQLYKNQLLKSASPLQSPQGIKCLEERNESLNASFAEMEQNLQSLLNGSKVSDQALFNEIKGQVNKIKDLNVLLEGGEAPGPGQMDKRAVNYTSLFQDSACRQVVGSEQVRKTGQQSGLRGIRDTVLSGIQEQAKEIRSIDFEGFVQERMNTINSKFARFGLEGIQNYDQATSGRDGFASLKDTYNDFYGDFNQKMKNVQRDLERYLPSLGAGKVPSLDKNFVRDLNQIRRLGSSDHEGSWKDRFMNICMSGQIPGASVRGGFDFLIDRLRRRGFSDEDEQLRYYKSFLSSLRDSQNSMAYKRAVLVKFHKEQSSRSQYGVTVLAPEGGELDVLEYFDQDMVNCDHQFSSLRVFQDAQTGTGLTYKEASTRALAVIAQGKEGFIRFPQEMENAVKAKVLRCEGITYNPTPTTNGGCSIQGDGALNRQSVTFCQVHAQNCAQAVNSCFSKLEREVTMREGERKRTANRVNDMINLYRGTLNIRLKSLVNQVKNFHTQLKTTYPFLAPLNLEEANLFIPVLTPEWNEQLREAIIDGGNPAEVQKRFQELVEVNIQKALNRQRSEIKSKIAKEIEEKKKGYRESQKSWESLVQQCRQTAEGYGKQMEEQEKKYQEDIVARNVVCSVTGQFNATSCSEESLTQLDEAFTQLSQTLAQTPGQLYGISEFKARCAGLNSLLDQQEERESEGLKPAMVSEICNIGEDIQRGVEEAAKKPEEEAYKVEEFKGIDRSHYSRFGLDIGRLSRLTGVSRGDIEAYLENPQEERQTFAKLTQVANPFIHQQLSPLLALSSGEFIKQCNKIRRDFSRRLYNSLKENRSTQRLSLDENSVSRVERYVELEDEALQGSVENNAIYAIEDLIKSQRAYQNRVRSFGFGEQTIPLCGGLRGRRNLDSFREEDRGELDVINSVIGEEESEKE